MIPAKPVVSVETNAISNQKVFDIAKDDVPMIFSILREGLYTDPLTAVIREYCTNAYDAHVQVGTPERPFSVSPPTEASPFFIVRDYGPGLSEDDMFRLFGSYGASTKRNTNEFVGMMGIGTKSAFSVSDQFTIRSFFNGLRTDYLVYLDDSNLGTISVVGQEDSTEDSGLEIIVPIPQHRIAEFCEKIPRVLQFFPVTPLLPKVSRVLDELQALVSNSQAITPNLINIDDRFASLYLDMGCCAYSIQDDHGRLTHLRSLLDLVGSMKGAGYHSSWCFRYPIGAFEISASREYVKITDSLIETLVETVEQYLSEAKKGLLSAAHSKATYREKLMQMIDILRGLSPKNRNYLNLSAVTWASRFLPHIQTGTGPTISYYFGYDDTSNKGPKIRQPFSVYRVSENPFTHEVQVYGVSWMSFLELYEKDPNVFFWCPTQAAAIRWYKGLQLNSSESRYFIASNQRTLAEELGFVLQDSGLGEYRPPKIEVRVFEQSVWTAVPMPSSGAPAYRLSNRVYFQNEQQPHCRNAAWLRAASQALDIRIYGVAKTSPFPESLVPADEVLEPLIDQAFPLEQIDLYIIQPQYCQVMITLEALQRCERNALFQRYWKLIERTFAFSRPVWERKHFKNVPLDSFRYQIEQNIVQAKKVNDPVLASPAEYRLEERRRERRKTLQVVAQQLFALPLELLTSTPFDRAQLLSNRIMTLSPEILSEWESSLPSAAEWAKNHGIPLR